MTVACIYARYSSDNQRDASIEDQIRLCSERAASQGWSVLKSYSDHGISGASLLLRPGIQSLLADAQAGKFSIVLAEALDRLSRDQEDIAAIYKRLLFAGVRIVTLAEGEVNELHVGLKGTMNALFLKDLADKTRRGLRGRVEAGRSGGGISYGYKVVRRIGADGEPARGEREIAPAEAGIIRRIFEEYASGKSTALIAAGLNEDGIPAPSGRTWGPSAIHGHQKRQTGILNNELYVGRLVWNRLRFIKDPDTGKRISRPNPKSAWIVKEVPALRIVDDELWQKAKARQAATEAKFGERNKGHIDRRQRSALLSGLVKCASCGGNYIILNRTRLGCSNAKYKGTCDNRRTVVRTDLEAAILDGLQHRLMDPRLTEAFCEEYTRAFNRLCKEQGAAIDGKKAELAKVIRERDRLVQAILDGVPAEAVRDKMAQLERRKGELESALANAKEEPLRLHPGLAKLYRAQIAALRETLAGEGRNGEAAELLRGAIERIEIVPGAAGKALTANLYGHLAGILALVSERKDRVSGVKEWRAMVAGAGFEPATFGL